MDYRFLAEIIERKPQLFKAVLSFNKPFSSALPPELAELGKPWTGLWNRPEFRRAWPLPDQPAQGYWNFYEESRRMALLSADTVERLCLFFSAAVHAEELSQVIARAQVLELRRRLGADVVTYALKRGRYQVSGLRAPLLVPASFGSLAERIDLLARTVPALVGEGWPEELRALAPPCFSAPKDQNDAAFVPSLRREQRTALWFTMKKLLLREVAPQWAPCFD